MKKIFILILMSACLNLAGQTEKRINGIRLETGFLFHWNTLNTDHYIDYVSPSGPNSASGLTGADLRIVFPTKFMNLDLIAGTLFEKCWDSYLTSSHNYSMNGGGVYAGISPCIKTKNFGFTSLFAIGMLSYKEYFYYAPDSNLSSIIERKKYSSGPGAISSLGIYGRIGPVGVHPQLQAVFSGGSNASFLFYGFILPLTVQF
ncbi:MAG TPA: hypothetical protein P5257_05295 [Bacteroidales bacterium]|nr:hypothetical protein [Bacteroidales bacterium]HRR94029.1 hypothetical protein [Bacteroidales bacterium]HRT89518.1 hypothetical protein [Bacteroidales bacterium]